MKSFKFDPVCDSQIALIKLFVRNFYKTPAIGLPCFEEHYQSFPFLLICVVLT